MFLSCLWTRWPQGGEKVWKWPLICCYGTTEFHHRARVRNNNNKKTGHIQHEISPKMVEGVSFSVCQAKGLCTSFSECTSHDCLPFKSSQLITHVQVSGAVCAFLTEFSMFSWGTKNKGLFKGNFQWIFQGGQSKNVFLSKNYSF